MRARARAPASAPAALALALPHRRPLPSPRCARARLQAQAFADPSKAAFLASRKTLEVNPRHPLIAAMATQAAADPQAINADTRDLVNILYDAALLNSGFQIDDAKDFSSRIFRVIKTGLKIDSFDLLPPIDVPVEEEEEEEDDETEDLDDDGEFDVDAAATAAAAAAKTDDDHDEL